MVPLKFNWQQTLASVVASLGLAGFVVRSFLTGEDIPVNFQILFAAIFGLSFGTAGISTILNRDKAKDQEKGDKDAE